MNTERVQNAAVLRVLRLQRFRNYSAAECDLDSGFNLFAGENAQGKTNLLEAVYLLSATRLLRSSRENDAIQSGERQAVVEGVLEPSETELRIVLESGLRKKAFLNGLPLRRAADLIGRLPSVAVSSLDMEIVRGEPAERRLFLDIELSQAYPSYLLHLTHYRRALEQRNALLKAAQAGFVADELFETWEEPLAEHGSALRRMRSEFVERLARVAQRVHPHMAPRERLSLGYAPKDDAGDEGALRLRFASMRGAEVARGSTLSGPHRDDVEIHVNGTDLRGFGSQGQQRTGAITMKLASLELSKELIGATPILLLDDILSDLDEGRRARLVEWVVASAGQTVLTCTEAAAAGPDILSRARVFQVAEGQIRQA